MTAVDAIGTLWQEVMLHLVEYITELCHLYPVKVYCYPIQPPCVPCRPVASRIAHRRHDSELRSLDLINLVQLIKDNVIPCLLPLNDGQYTIAPLIFWVPFPLKAPLWEHLSVKLSWCNCLIELPQPLIFHLEQLLISRLSCHKKHPLSALLE